MTDPTLRDKVIEALAKHISDADGHYFGDGATIEYTTMATAALAAIAPRLKWWKNSLVDEWNADGFQVVDLGGIVLRIYENGDLDRVEIHPTLEAAQAAAQDHALREWLKTTPLWKDIADADSRGD